MSRPHASPAHPQAGFPRVSGDEPYRKPHNGYHIKRLSFGAQFNTRPGLSASDAYPHAEAGTVRLRVGEPPPPVHPAGSACRPQRGCQPCRRLCEPAASAREPKVREPKEGWRGRGSGRARRRGGRRGRCDRWCRYSRRSRRHWRGKRRGFSLHEAFWRRVIGVSDPRVVQFPLIGSGEVAP